LNLK
jgi:S1-C subfamily serine protease